MSTHGWQSAILLLACAAGCADDDCPEGTTRVAGRCVHAVSRDGGSGDDGGTACDAGLVTAYRDADGDGFGDDGTRMESCSLLEGTVDVGGDCDDLMPAVHPGAPEACNGLDDDCAGGPDDPFECPQGGDVTCTTECGSQGSVLCSDTCTAPGTCPIPEETCNYVDDDCDGVVDEELQGLLGEPIPLGADGDRVTYAGLLLWADGLAILSCDDDVTRLTTFDGRQQPLLVRQPVEADLEGFLEFCLVTAAAAVDDHMLLSLRVQPDGGGPYSSLLASVDLESGVVDTVNHWPGRSGAYVNRLAEFIAVGDSLVSLSSFTDTESGDPGIRLWTHEADGAARTELLALDGPWASDIVESEGGVELALALSYRNADWVEVSKLDGEGTLTTGPATIDLEGHEALYVVIVESSEALVLLASTDIGLGPLYAVQLDRALNPGSLASLGSGVVQPGGAASAGQDYVLIRTTTAGPEYLRISPDGGIVDGPASLGDSVPQSRIGQVAWTGSHYELLWATDSGDGYAQVMLQRYGCE